MLLASNVLTSVDQLRIILLTRRVFSNASQTPSDAITTLAPVSGTRT